MSDNKSNSSTVGSRKKAKRGGSYSLQSNALVFCLGDKIEIAHIQNGRISELTVDISTVNIQSSTGYEDKLAARGIARQSLISKNLAADVTQREFSVTLAKQCSLDKQFGLQDQMATQYEYIVRLLKQEVSNFITANVPFVLCGEGVNSVWLKRRLRFHFPHNPILILCRRRHSD